jgi:hypothetical protein
MDTWFYYFGHPERANRSGADDDTLDGRRCAVYRARLTVERGELLCRA